MYVARMVLQELYYRRPFNESKHIFVAGASRVNAVPTGGMSAPLSPAAGPRDTPLQLARTRVCRRPLFCRRAARVGLCRSEMCRPGQQKVCIPLGSSSISSSIYGLRCPCLSVSRGFTILHVSMIHYLYVRREIVFHVFFFCFRLKIRNCREASAVISSSTDVF